MNIVLASQSPRRKQLLAAAQLDFEIAIVPTDEKYPNELAYHLVPEYIAQQKAKAVYQLLVSTEKMDKDTLILAADTIVVLQGEIIGKPKDFEDALNILRKLSGQQHEVITGVFMQKGMEVKSFHSVTKVQFNELSDEQIKFYIEKYQPYDKAGAYAIQEWIGLVGISGIDGDMYNVIGLPINKVMQALNTFH